MPIAPQHRIYLSGGMEHAEQHGAAWRTDLSAWLKAELGAEVFNPVEESRQIFDRELPGADVPAIRSSDPERFARVMRTIVLRDCNEIALHSTLVICLWDSAAARGAGTKGEITIAAYFGKPVYLVTAEGSAQLPGWVRGCTERTFPSFSALKAYLMETAE